MKNGDICLPNMRGVISLIDYEIEDATTDDFCEEKGKKYKLTKYVKFNTDEYDPVKIIQAFVRRLAYAEIMKFLEKRDGKTIFSIYERIPN